MISLANQLDSALYFGAAWAATSCVVILATYLSGRNSGWLSTAVWSASALVAACIAWKITGDLTGFILFAFVSGLALVLRRVATRLTSFGVGLLSKKLGVVAIGLLAAGSVGLSKQWSVLG